jgi:SOS response regulatory protein OraA/RecX
MSDEIHEALVRAALEAAVAFILENKTHMFTGPASDFVQTRTRSPEELSRMLEAHADDPEAIAEIVAKVTGA